MSNDTRIIANQNSRLAVEIQPKPSIGGTPLDRLKAGHLDEVINAAEGDFGEA